MRIIPTFALVVLLGSSTLVRAQQREEPLPFGNMDQWVKREIKESAIIGGELKNIYAVGPTSTIKGEVPYKPTGGSPWATSNVMAKVVGIVKTNSSVSPRHVVTVTVPVWIPTWRV